MIYVFEYAGARAYDLIRIRVAKAKLYEAKVGIIIVQRMWSKFGLGMLLNPAFLLDEYHANKSIDSNQAQRNKLQ